MHVAQPAAATLVAWGNAWLNGHAGLDDAVDEVERLCGPQVVAGLPAATPDTETPLRSALAGLRAEGLDGFRLALPAPGDPLGLPGPAPFTADAVQAGQAVLLTAPGTPLGLVPHEDRRGSSYVGTRWQVTSTGPGLPDVPSLPEADRQLTLAMRDATEAMLTVDGIGGAPPEWADAVAALRRPGETGTALAPGYPARAHRLAALAGRLSLVVGLVRDANGQVLSAGQARCRDEALRALDHAVRRALVAAHNSVFEPVT